MSSSTWTFLVRNTCTTLGYMPSGSCSSFCTRFSLPSFDRSAPGTCRENLDLSSSTEYRDRDRRTGRAATVVGASSSDSESSFFSSGHRSGHNVVRLYLFRMACSRAGSMTTLKLRMLVCMAVCCLSRSGRVPIRGMPPPITAAHRLAHSRSRTTSRRNGHLYQVFK